VNGHPFSKNSLRWLSRIIFFLVYVLFFGLFYYTYVPLVLQFQMILVPVLLAAALLTILDVGKGILFFVFAFPLINNLPYLSGIEPDIPHAPTALVLFLAFLLGFFLRGIFLRPRLVFDNPVFRPLVLLAVLVTLSGLLTFCRYTNYFPFLTAHIRDLVVNTNGVRVGGALMSSVFSSLNYATGFLFFGIVYNAVRSKEFLKKILFVLSMGASLALFFAFVQRFYSPALGNTPFFESLGQLNSTFKDPNSFGLFAAAFCPVLLGMFFSLKKFPRYFCLILIAMSFIVLFWIGSRSSMLGLLSGTIVFFFLISIRTRPKFQMKHVIALLMIVMVLAAVVFLSRETILFERTIGKIGIFTSRDFAKHLLGPKKLGCWQTALFMLRKHPLTGIGVGSYIIELPNFAGRLEISSVLDGYTDSAENYFLQVGSEMGLIGLGVALWLFVAVYRLICGSLRNTGANDRDQFLLIGLIAGLTVVFVSIFFHSYLGAFDAKYFIWLLVGSICVFFPRKERPVERKSQFVRPFKSAALVLCAIFGVLFLWYSLTDLSLSRSTAENNIDQNFGLYKDEIDPDGRVFRWAKKEAGISVTNAGEELHIPIKASHPGMEKHPVSVNIYLSDEVFSTKVPIGSLLLKGPEWHDFAYALKDILAKKVYLLFETDRTWQPKKLLGENDPRWLAIALGDPWFRPKKTE